MIEGNPNARLHVSRQSILVIHTASFVRRRGILLENDERDPNECTCEVLRDSGGTKCRSDVLRYAGTAKYGNIVKCGLNLNKYII